MQLADRMQYFPIEDTLSARHIFGDFRPDLIEELLQKLTTDNLRWLICFLLRLLFSWHFDNSRFLDNFGKKNVFGHKISAVKFAGSTPLPRFAPVEVLYTFAEAQMSVWN